MSNDEIAQLSLFKIALEGWRLALENPIAALLIIALCLIILRLAYKYLERNSLADIFANKSDVMSAKKKLGIKEK